MGVGSPEAPRVKSLWSTPTPLLLVGWKKGGGYGLHETGELILLPGHGRLTYLMKERVRTENAGCSEEVVVTHYTYLYVTK